MNFTNGKTLPMATVAQLRLERAYRVRLASFLGSIYGEGKLETNEAFDLIVRETVKGVRF